MNYNHCTLIVLFLSLLLIPSHFLSAQSENESENEDSTVQRGLSFNGYPYAYYTPETQFAFGVGGIMVLYTGDDKNLLPSKVTLGGSSKIRGY